MKRRIANTLIRVARRLDANCCLDYQAIKGNPSIGKAVINIEPRIDLDALQRAVDQAHRSAQAFAQLTRGGKGWKSL